LHINASA